MFFPERERLSLLMIHLNSIGKKGCGKMSRQMIGRPKTDFSFHYGFIDDLHPDPGVNFQMNRWINYLGNDALEDMREIAPKPRDYPSYVREFLAQDRRLHAAYYYRSAEFFMNLDDPRKTPTRSKFLQLALEWWGIQENDRFVIPYEQDAKTVFLPAYRFTPDQPKGTLVIFGGSDSCIEEFFPVLMVLVERGYDIVLFEGPGQGRVLAEQQVPLIPDWHNPVAAVLDYFKLKDVTLIGVSMGGYMVLEAAAFEPRVKRAIAWDILFNGFDIWLGRLEPVQRVLVKILFKLNAAPVFNALIEQAMRKSMVVDWGMRQSMYILGVRTPFEYLQKQKSFGQAGFAHRVTQDVLLLAGSEDFGIPLEQFYRQIEALKHVRSLTARLFTRAEQAQNHCQVGNLELALDVIIDWIELISRHS
jgi:pimeloyl-ACP methyl ester carboxylesterase